MKEGFRARINLTICAFVKIDRRILGSDFFMFLEIAILICLHQSSAVEYAMHLYVLVIYITVGKMHSITLYRHLRRPTKIQDSYLPLPEHLSTFSNENGQQS